MNEILDKVNSPSGDAGIRNMSHSSIAVAEMGKKAGKNKHKYE